ncbi:hypothetical protein ACTTAI_04730 [Rhodobacter capsulatus]|uniref:hypothetical protein n=1 Tax=Rhodobacter capsulatus TaxID=1061 RepID=UPI00402953AA
MAGRCIFCGVEFGTKGPESRSSAEHFWSKKLAKSLKAPANIRGPKKHAETHISESGVFEVRANPVFVQKGHWLYQTIPDTICKSCNSSWLNSLQGPAVDSILRLRSDSFFAQARVDYPAIAKWIYSRFLLHISTYPAESIFKGAAGLLREINSQREKENRRFYLEKVPPLTSAVYYAPISFAPALVTAANLMTMFYPENDVPREAFLLTMLSKMFPSYCSRIFVFLVASIGRLSSISVAGRLIILRVHRSFPPQPGR